MLHAADASKQCDKDPEGTKAGSLCSQVSGVFVRMFCGERFSGRTARKLEEVLDQMNLEALPRTREEFENRAILFHVLMDLILGSETGFLEAHPRHPDTM